MSTAVVELEGITKRFPGVVANDGITLSVNRGEVHCLLGENGAGKSTLMAILSGMQRADEGQIKVDGRPVEIDSPRAALRLGIGTVYQHSTLIPALTVIENLMLGDGHGLALDAGRARRRLRELGAMLGVDVDPEAVVADLALGRQQQIEIVKALWRGSRVLILDEPTSMLTPQAVGELEKVLERLKAGGLAIIFITHKLHEAAALGDRISVLREGRLVGELDEAEVQTLGPAELERRVVGLMFGDVDAPVASAVELRSELSDVTDPVALTAAREVGEAVLELRDVSAPGRGSEPGIEDVSLTVRRGEIVGVAGVDGNGQRALAEAVGGQRSIRRGEIAFLGAPIGRFGVRARERLGLRYLTDDRLGEGIVGGLSVALNIFLKRIGQPPYWRHGRIRTAAINEQAAALVQRFDIRTPSVDTRAATLSGGNIQKLLLARELSFDATVVVFHKPTHGLDLMTTRAVREMIRGLRDGRAALVISTDLDELLEVSDRIVVLSRGRLVGEVAAGPTAAQEIGSLMIGDVTLGAETVAA